MKRIRSHGWVVAGAMWVALTIFPTQSHGQAPLTATQCNPQGIQTAGQNLLAWYASQNPPTNPLTDVEGFYINGAGMGQVTSQDPVTQVTSVQNVCYVQITYQSINVWVVLPVQAVSNALAFNGFFVALGGGGWGGSGNASASASNQAAHLVRGYAIAVTDTGHTAATANFGMASAGMPNTILQADYSYWSQHMMAEVGKFLVKAFYGNYQNSGGYPTHAVWDGCSDGGREGLMMAQRFPADFDGILAGSPAIHLDKVMASSLWPAVVLQQELAASYTNPQLQSALQPQLISATQAVIAACDTKVSGLHDGFIADPRDCSFNVNTLLCPSGASPTKHVPTCITQDVANALNKIWAGPTAASGSQMWYAIPKGAVLDDTNAMSVSSSNVTGEYGLAGPPPVDPTVTTPTFGDAAGFFGIGSARYWTYFNPNWNWATLTESSFQTFFDNEVLDKSTAGGLETIVGTDDANLSTFAKNGKLIIYQGWSDWLVEPQGAIDYFHQVQADTHTNQDFLRLFMVPGMGHCGDAPSDGKPVTLFSASKRYRTQLSNLLVDDLVNWLISGTSGKVTTLLESFPEPDNGYVRPVCPYPEIAVWNKSTTPGANSAYGEYAYLYSGPGDANMNYACGPATHVDTETLNQLINQPLIGGPYYVPPAIPPPSPYNK